MEKNFETEYFFIDFQYTILGSIIRSVKKNPDNPIIDKFNNLKYADLLQQKTGES